MDSFDALSRSRCCERRLNKREHNAVACSIPGGCLQRQSHGGPKLTFCMHSVVCIVSNISMFHGHLPNLNHAHRDTKSTHLDLDGYAWL